MKPEYFNPLRKSHLVLLKYLETQLSGKDNKVAMAPYGKNTQHLFVNGNYFMTINWNLI